MNHLGHIEIKDKVVFVYYEFSEPKTILDSEFNKKMRKHLASKREVEVKNWLTIDTPDKNCSILLAGKEIGEYVWNNQPCEAEVKNDKATIVKII